MKAWVRIAGGGAGLAAAAAALVWAGASSQALAQANDDPGKAVYEQFCASCHEKPEAGSRAAPVAGLRRMSRETIVTALTTGVMKPIGDQLDRRQIQQVAAYLAAPPAAVGTGWIDDNRCAAGRTAVDLSARPAQVGYGVDADNSRRMTAAQAGLKTADVAKLEKAWAFAIPGASGLRGQGVVVGNTLFYPAGQANHVLALDTQTGCVKWATRTPSQMRASLAYGRLGPKGPMALVGGDSGGQLIALDAKTGKILWRADPRHDKNVPLSGTPLFAGDKIIVPISAADVSLAMRQGHECCKSHGDIAAVSAADGKVLWTWHTMPDAKPLGRKNSAGVEMYGPSGAPIWSSPSFDPKRNVVYASTGENTSPPATGTSDALVAIDAATGKEKWVFQALANDIWHMGCPIGKPRPGQTVNPNCFFAGEGSVLLDHDFGGGPVIWRGRGGRELILGGQKSGDVWAVDARNGKVVWHQKYGEGTALGGVHWGIATDGTRVFAPIADPNVPAEKNAAGLYAIDIASGKEVWRWKAQPDCANGRDKRAPGCQGRFGLSAPPLVIDGAVLAGSLDGKLYVFEAATGKLLATHDTTGEHETVNKVAGKGGTIDAAGPFAGDGMVFVSSGYGSFGQIPGNTLIALRPKK